MNVYEKLSKIQCELHAPKNLVNKFGGYNYRNAEGILEELKPFFDKYKCAVTLDDFIWPTLNRVYVQAKATFIDCETEQKIEVNAYAREAESKKGYDEAQITGAASSYARKHALNGLFALDDTKDADSDEYRKTADNKAKKELVVTEENKNNKIDSEELELLKAEAKRTGTTPEKLKKHFGVKNISELTKVQYQAAIDKLTTLPDAEEAK